MTQTMSAPVAAGGPPPHGLQMPADGDGADARGQTAQFITFKVGEEEYGVDIMTVREIKGWTETTKLPNSAPYVRGVLDLRGTIVPIYDLRSRFGHGDTSAGKTHVVVIVAVGGTIIGILVDAVSDILTVAAADIRAVPETDRGVDQRFLTGLVTVQDRMVALLALQRLFDLQEHGNASADAKTALD